MKRFLCSLSLLLAFQPPLSGSAEAQQISVIDDGGNLLVLEQPAQRIVSLAPSMTELLFSIGAGSRIVGVMAFSDYPPAATTIPVVGQFDLLDMEGILALQPDLIVAWKTGNPRSSIARLQALGIPVYIAEPTTLASIATELEKLARLTGLEDQGQSIAADFLAALDGLAQANADKPAVSVFYQVWDSPLISVGGPELINDIIRRCGGRNIFADLPVGPKVSVEAVLSHNPDVIIASGMDANRPPWLDDWQVWSQLNAVKNDNLFFIPPDLVQRHSLRALQGTRQMCAHLDQARSNITAF
ncbi:MAG: cobalamin-binding protein [Pseudomonadales bacterium]|nr:cobalamin-binding protein [Pseudomonadales bacterium]